MTKIGASFADLSVTDILQNIDTYADILLERKVLAFRGIKLSIEQHHVLINALTTRKWDQSFDPDEKTEYITSDHGETFSVYAREDVMTDGTNGYVIPKRNHAQIEPAHITGDPFEFFKWSVHVDTPQDPDNPIDILQSYTSMHMHLFAYPETVGRTKFLSLTELYDNCPEEYKEKLLGKKIREYKNSGTLHLGTWDALIKHPDTKEKMLFWPSWYVGLDGENEPWFDEMLDWVRAYMKDTSNWFFWSWRENDFIIFDNRALVHSFEGGWESKNRIFSQGGIGSGTLVPLTKL